MTDLPESPRGQIMANQSQRRRFLVSLFVVGLLGGCSDSEMTEQTIQPKRRQRQRRDQPQQPATDEKQADPFTIADVKFQRLIDQCLVSVVVPEDATLEELQECHPEIMRRYSGQAKHVMINYYRGRFEMDANRLIATDYDGGGLTWVAVDGSGN